MAGGVGLASMVTPNRKRCIRLYGVDADKVGADW